MSTDSVLQIDRAPAYRRETSNSLFTAKATKSQDTDWLNGAMPGSAIQESGSAQDVPGGEPWIKVAPDYYVKKSEYQRRFGEFDLDYYRQRMSPKLFTAFVRYMGVVPGSPELDVVELTTPPDY